MPLKYAVIGSGAIGAYYGGMLAKGGHDVHFLFHSDYEYVKQNGLKVDSIHGDFSISPINAYKSTSDMPVCDVVLVGLKSTNNHRLKELLPPLLDDNTIVILIQNGLELEADLAKDFPDLNIAGAMAFICSSKIGDGHITHLDQGNINIGSYSCRDENKLQQVCDDFNASGVACKMVDLEPARWKKLLWNIPFNGITVVLNTTTKKILENPDTRQLMLGMMYEVVEAANKVGEDRFRLPRELVASMIAITDNMLPYSPSMKLDYDNKRPLEIEYIYSRPIEKALRAGYKMELAMMLEKQLRFIESTYIKE